MFHMLKNATKNMNMRRRNRKYLKMQNELLQMKANV